MQVRHGLTRGVTGIESDVEAIRARNAGKQPRPFVVVQQQTTHMVDQIKDCGLLVAGCVPPLRDVAVRNHEGVAGGDRESVEDGERKVIRGEPAVAGDGKEGGVPLIPPDHGLRIAAGLDRRRAFGDRGRALVTSECGVVMWLWVPHHWQGQPRRYSDPLALLSCRLQGRGSAADDQQNANTTCAQPAAGE